MYVSNNNVIYFNSFEVEYIQKQIAKLIEGSVINASTITKTIYSLQAYDSVTCGYFCIEFIVFMLKGKSLTVLTNLFSLNN